MNKYIVGIVTLFLLIIVGFSGCASTTDASTIDPDDDPEIKSNLPIILFKPDSTELTAGEDERVLELIDMLKQAGEGSFLIIGHSADVGRPEGQQKLSEERAASIAQRLIAGGILPGAIRYEGRGATDPVADNTTAQGRAQNRRVEVEVTILN
ncbi:MAG: OmpA family protein [Salinispira sp.]